MGRGGSTPAVAHRRRVGVELNGCLPRDVRMVWAARYNADLSEFTLTTTTPHIGERTAINCARIRKKNTSLYLFH